MSSAAAAAAAAGGSAVPPAARRPRFKVFNDAVHGAIELHPLSAKIIDTVEFQRLRRLKQLGGAYSVFPAASHNRFEHCLGVAWMAKSFCRHLRDKQPELQLSDTEMLCVEVAGLVHDLGHGVMSHMFDNKFIPRVRAQEGLGATAWSHEWASCALLEALWANNREVAAEAELWGIGSRELHFIQELVLGGPGDDLPPGFVWAGWRGAAGQFLYEIVANKRSGIDVDKWDYVQRDSRQLGVPQAFEHSRLLLLARVVEDAEGISTIAYPVKEAWSIYQLFAARFNLHKKAYQHRVARVIEFMAMEALLAANDHIL
jgi:HD superfamily phosphohydrolase